MSADNQNSDKDFLLKNIYMVENTKLNPIAYWLLTGTSKKSANVIKPFQVANYSKTY